jgi:hypothetical protein
LSLCLPDNAAHHTLDHQKLYKTQSNVLTPTEDSLGVPVFLMSPKSFISITEPKIQARENTKTR